MVEFISETTEKQELDEPPPGPEEQISQPALEELVEEQIDELHSIQPDQAYVDEPSNASGEYNQPEHQEIILGTELKHELKPMVYEDNEQIILVDIFEKYGKSLPSDDKWWKKRTNY